MDADSSSPNQVKSQNGVSFDDTMPVLRKERSVVLHLTAPGCRLEPELELLSRWFHKFQLRTTVRRAVNALVTIETELKRGCAGLGVFSLHLRGSLGPITRRTRTCRLALLICTRV